MRADFSNDAFAHDDDSGRVPYRREPMRNDERCAPFHQLFNRRFDGCFRFAVERARRFVENQYRRVAQNRPRD